MRRIAALLLVVLAGTAWSAPEVEYRPGGKALQSTWQAFYVEAFHEPEIADPLIAQGKLMVPLICEAITHKDMKRRRYAISALGSIKDQRALATLEAILNDPTEIAYFREDSLWAIYRTDAKLGLHYAAQFKDHVSLYRVSQEILKAQR